MGFRAKESIKINIIINDQNIEKVCDFNYLENDTGYRKNY